MHLPHTILAKLILSVLIGGVIGMEREIRSKSAGFRTIILICLGATLFTIFSQVLGYPGNMDRVASNIVTGIGFLGAGVIFRSNARVNGITTAATIWLSAALGMGIGCGYYAASIVGLMLVMIVLAIFSLMDRVLDRMNQVREYKITYPYEESMEHKYEDIINEFKLKIRSRANEKIGNIITGSWTVTGSEKEHHLFIERVLHDPGVTEFSY
jgi:putative Mg2+ transporter-C (MgtC) family protein